MRVQYVPSDPEPRDPPEVVVAIGNFDGVHRGHRSLIGRVVERAAELGVQSAVVTFDPHPRHVLRPDQILPALSTIADRLELLESLGVDHVLVWRFDSTVQHTPAEAFVEQLNRRVRLRRILHGPGFALGERRAGTPTVLAEIGRRLGFELEEVQPFRAARGVRSISGAAAAEDALARRYAAEPVSSTGIRSLVQAGRIGEATRVLGRLPALVGVVEEGERVGRTLGFPTANLRIDGPMAIPADGVYAAWAELHPYTIRAQRLPAAVSIGTRPTFEGTKRVVEAYLLDFSGDLYRQALRLHFVARLRGQERFDDLGSLVAQMRRDVQTTRAILLQAQAEHDEPLLAADG